MGFLFTATYVPQLNIEGVPMVPLAGQKIIMLLTARPVLPSEPYLAAWRTLAGCCAPPITSMTWWERVNPVFRWVPREGISR